MQFWQRSSLQSPDDAWSIPIHDVQIWSDGNLAGRLAAAVGLNGISEPATAGLAAAQPPEDHLPSPYVVSRTGADEHTCR